MKHTEPKRVCAIHDLSAFGRCALTVVIPTLSALGIQTVPLPTALMSTHTGGYEDIYIRDLTEDMRPMAAHWKKLGVTFDSIYSGFVLSPEQGHIISDIIDDFRTDGTLVLVDPVMGDDGELYSTCTAELREVMAHLCGKADVITPNLTEACMLTGTPYPHEGFGCEAAAREAAAKLLTSLSALCPRIAITGIEYTEGEGCCVMTACANNGEARFFPQAKVGASYPGTGELFASVLLGLCLDGRAFFDSAEYAGRFVSETITCSHGVIAEPRHGTALESALSRLNK